MTGVRIQSVLRAFANAALICVTALTAACVGLNTPEPAQTPSRVGGSVGDQAPEFTMIANWLNSDPLTMEELRGNVVLIDFWTYTCVNCIRTFPYLLDWHEKYADRGLVLVGVHSPEFAFEKNTSNVERAIAAYGLSYPVAQDNDFGTWNSYENRYWPAKYLVDKDGVVRYHRFGEGGYVDVEEQIRSLLTEAGFDVSQVPVGTDDGPRPDRNAFIGEPEDRLTREIYGGYERNSAIGGLYVADVNYYEAPERLVEYEDDGRYQNQFIKLQGLWYNGMEALQHGRETENYEDYIALQFVASSVNGVVGYEGQPYEVRVTMDGRPLRENEAGPDVIVDDRGSYFRVDEARMYEIVDLGRYGAGILKLSSNSSDFSLFTLTFGAYGHGP